MCSKLDTRRDHCSLRTATRLILLPLQRSRFLRAYLNRKSALVVPLLLMAVSDVFLGLHDVVAFTWADSL